MEESGHDFIYFYFYYVSMSINFLFVLHLLLVILPNQLTPFTLQVLPIFVFLHNVIYVLLLLNMEIDHAFFKLNLVLKVNLFYLMKYLVYLHAFFTSQDSILLLIFYVLIPIFIRLIIFLYLYYLSQITMHLFLFLFIQFFFILLWIIFLNLGFIFNILF